MKQSILNIALLTSLLFSVPVLAMDSELQSRLEAAMNGEHRSDKNKARNQYRNPVETMAFFGLTEEQEKSQYLFEEIFNLRLVD